MAVNVAINLGRPLLLSGEPGTGKTDLAASIAWQLQLPPPLEFVSRSTSEYADILYRVDHLGRMQQAYANRENPGKDSSVTSLREFLSFGALGEAIIKAMGTSGDSVIDRVIWGKDAPAKTRSVVLIDEVDKTPQDFPNDLLVEFDKLKFSIPEVYEDNEQKTLREFTVPQDDPYRPILIVTSNASRALPDAFLRRCVYHHITFPEDIEVIKSIVRRRVLGSLAPSLEIDEAIEFFCFLRKQNAIGKKPATAELLDLARTLHARSGNDSTDSKQWDALAAMLLLKRQEDQSDFDAYITQWRDSRNGTSS